MTRNDSSQEVWRKLQDKTQASHSSETEKSVFALRVCFPQYRSVENELMKAGLLRVVVGIIVLARFLEVLHTHHVLGDASEGLFVNGKIQVFF